MKEYFTKAEFLNRSLGHLGCNWDRAISAASEYSWILNVRVGPCGVVATLKYGALGVFDNMRKCVTPIGPATFRKSLRLFRFFSCKTGDIKSVLSTLTHKPPLHIMIENSDNCALSSLTTIISTKMNAPLFLINQNQSYCLSMKPC